MSADGVKIFNPAFDVTDADLITGIITEYGVAVLLMTLPSAKFSNERRPIHYDLLF